MRLKGRSALVTGAGRGIGKQICGALAADGARLALLARSREQLVSTAAELDVECMVVPADLGKEAQISEALAEVLREWDGIDILVNNAGMLGPVGPSHTLDVTQWMETLQVNLGGCFRCCAAVLPGMIARGYGKIINLSGGGAVNPRPNFSAYAASKAAVVRLTETLAAETSGKGIDVNAIAPGAINTAMLSEALAAGDAASAEAEELQRYAEEGGQDPARAAALVAWLASPAADGLSGRLISAIWDDWNRMDVAAVMSSDLYTMKRIDAE